MNYEEDLHINSGLENEVYQAKIALEQSLNRKVPSIEIPLASGVSMQLREGDYRDADNIHTLDGNVYTKPSLAIGRQNVTSFRIASTSTKPLEPIGYYFISLYTKSREFAEKLDNNPAENIGEPKLVYVTEQNRDKHYGSVLIVQALLEIISDFRIGTLNMQVQNKNIDNMLQKLGFYPIGTGSYGYRNYIIDLSTEREKVRGVFQKYLDQFTHNK